LLSSLIISTDGKKLSGLAVINPVVVSIFTCFRLLGEAKSDLVLIKYLFILELGSK